MTKDTIRTEIEKRITNFLEKPDLSALEIKYLAEAYSELNKNDLMQEIISQPTYLGNGFGGLENSNVTLFNTKENN